MEELGWGLVLSTNVSIKDVPRSKPKWMWFDFTDSW